MEEIKRIFDILELYKTKYSELEDAFAYKKFNPETRSKEWHKVSGDKYYRYSHLLACALIDNGFKKEDKIITLSPSLPHWNIADMAISMANCIHVPIHLLGNEEMEKVFIHSDAKAIFVADDNFLKKISPILEKVKNIKNIYSFFPTENPNIKTIMDLIKEAKSNEKILTEKLIAIKSKITSDDIHTIIYTSGTTGEAKGVMLTHKNIINNFTPLFEPLPNRYKDHCLSFLPLSHVYERMLNYAFQALGSSIYYAENLGTILRDLKESQPVIFNSVPRVLEKFYDGIISKGKDLKGIKRIIFFWAIRLGYKFHEKGKNPLFYRIKLRFAKKFVFSQIQELFGGKLKVIVSGGSALQVRLAKLYNAIGFDICEGYGLTETSPVISVNLPDWKTSRKLGTIGPILKGVEVKIAEDGEILTRGNCVMKGYYKNPKMTEEVIDKDGWFHTGDIGELDEGYFLKITDRKKEIFKTSGGKYIAPQVIENKFKASNLIEQIMIVGENEKFVSALISPNFNWLHFYAKKHKISYKEDSDLINNEIVVKKIQREINDVNITLAEHEKIKRFRLVAEEWTQQTGELSQTLKLKRKVIRDKYISLLESIYGHGKDEDKLIEVEIASIIKEEIAEIKNVIEHEK